jgi:PAS domain S-box-containing protein
MPSQPNTDLSALIDSTDDFIWSVDVNYRLVAFNAALRAYYAINFGTRAEVGMRPEDLLPRDRAAIWYQHYERALTDGSFQTESTRADDRVTQLTLNRMMGYGNVLGVSVFGRDITELKAAERCKQEAERSYQAIFTGALEGIYQTTISGHVLSANPALA